MSALEVSRSMLINQGLSLSIERSAALELAEAAPAADVVGSFKRLVNDESVLVADREFVGLLAGLESPLELATFFINAKYTDVGGAGGLLGRTAGAVAASGDGYKRVFENGVIYWHARTGAHELHGPIRSRWQELGAERSFLGFPTSDVRPGADVRSEGVFAHFQGGSIYWAPSRGRVAGELDSALSAASVSAVALSASRAGWREAAAPLSPARETRASAVLSASGQLAMGALAAAEPSLARNGSVIATGVKAPSQAALERHLLESSAGAFEVHGAIREKYLALGAEASILGYPRSDETGAPDGTGKLNHFQGGSIYWTASTGAYEVHGLIRERWSSLGWERNPGLGYPISDELIPDRRIGHRRPEVRKKPLLTLPLDVIKLPAEAAGAGFPRSVVNTPVAAAAVVTEVAAALPRAAVRRAPGSSGVLGKLSDKALQSSFGAAGSSRVSEGLVPVLVAGQGVVLGRAPGSTPAEERSQNRFGDFESGLLFWFRGAESAITLSPLAATRDGTQLSMTGAEVASATLTNLGRTRFEGQNVQLGSIGFVGTTGYSFDGAQVHNRRHRLQLVLQGVESGQVGLVSVPLPVTATVELLVEVWFDALERRIALTPVEWNLQHASSGSYAASVRSLLHGSLDGQLWSNHTLTALPDTDGGAPIAILSVKTFPNGAVAVYVEPERERSLVSAGNLVHGVVPSVMQIVQPV